MHQTMKNTLDLLITLSKLTKKRNSKATRCLMLFYYVLKKLRKILSEDSTLELRCLPNEEFATFINKRTNLIDQKCNFVDENLYVLRFCNEKNKKSNETINWFHLAHKSVKKSCLLAVVFAESKKKIEERYVYTSETLKRNLICRLNLKESNSCSGYFLVPADHQATFATQTKISLIKNPNGSCANDFLIKDLLENYFSTPKYLRTNDLFNLNVKTCAPELKYRSSSFKIDRLHFKVNSMMGKKKEDDTPISGGFVSLLKTNLFQEDNINAYLVPKYDRLSWPVALNDKLDELKSCLIPFLIDKNNSTTNIRPLFLVLGPNGSGKRRLIKTTADFLGLNYIETNFVEIQSLTSAQTEAKLRIILEEAESCVPSLLLLRNLQIFGINAEGKKDERVLAAFETEIKKLYVKKSKYPLIIVATSIDSDIPIDVDKIFLEKIYIEPLDLDKRTKILSWCIEIKGTKSKIDTNRIAKICSDFTLLDIEALVLHAVKRRFFCNNQIVNDDVVLTDEDFDFAIEHMRSTFSDHIGAPEVPKVTWQDIGGLDDLKREIKRRIEMPLSSKNLVKSSGLLLYGPPGTGKTLLAKAVANECQLHFLSVKGPELLNMYVGQSEKNVRQIFEKARSAAPCIVFFDELDSLAPNRGQSGDSGGVMDRVVSQLLTEMDGLEQKTFNKENKSIFVFGATNRPDLIDPALLRPGRFDKILYVGVYTDYESKLNVIEALARNFNLEKNIKFNELIDTLPKNLTGADLYSVCSNAWLLAVERHLTFNSEPEKLEGSDVVVELQDFLLVCKDFVPSVSREELLQYEKFHKESLG